MTTSRVGRPRRRSKPELRGGNPGFTLIELILVLGLLALVAMLSVPRLINTLSGQGLRQECRRMVALTQYARSEAINSGFATEVWIDPETGQYGMRSLAPDSTNSSGATMGKTGSTARTNLNAGSPVDSKAGRSEKAYTLGKALKFEADVEPDPTTNEYTARFEPDGTLEATSFDEISITRDDGTELVIVKSDHAPEYSVETREEADEIADEKANATQEQQKQQQKQQTSR